MRRCLQWFVRGILALLILGSAASLWGMVRPWSLDAMLGPRFWVQLSCGRQVSRLVTYKELPVLDPDQRRFVEAHKQYWRVHLRHEGVSSSKEVVQLHEGVVLAQGLRVSRSSWILPAVTTLAALTVLLWRRYPPSALWREWWTPSGLGGHGWGTRRIIRRGIATSMVAFALFPLALWLAGNVRSFESNWSSSRAALGLTGRPDLVGVSIRLGGSQIVVRADRSQLSATISTPTTHPNSATNPTLGGTPIWSWQGHGATLSIRVRDDSTLRDIFSAQVSGTGQAYWEMFAQFPSWSIPVLLAVLLAWPILGFFWRTGRRARRIIEGVCLNCGYDLTGLTEPRCPECGKPLDQMQ